MLVLCVSLALQAPAMVIYVPRNLLEFFGFLDLISRIQGVKGIHYADCNLKQP